MTDSTIRHFSSAKLPPVQPKGEEKASAELIFYYRNTGREMSCSQGDRTVYPPLQFKSPPPHCSDSYLCCFKGSCHLHSYINKRERSCLAVLAVPSAKAALVCLAALALAWHLHCSALACTALPVASAALRSGSAPPLVPGLTQQSAAVPVAVPSRSAKRALLRPSS